MAKLCVKKFVIYNVLLDRPGLIPCEKLTTNVASIKKPIYKNKYLLMQAEIHLNCQHRWIFQCADGRFH